MSNKTKLPDELSAEVNQFIKDKIEIEREYWNKCSADSDRAKTYVAGYGKGVSAGATEYATKLHEAQQENEKLKAIANLWRPLMEEVVKRFEGAAETADQDYDLNLIKQIKRFLYGE